MSNKDFFTKANWSIDVIKYTLKSLELKGFIRIEKDENGNRRLVPLIGLGKKKEEVEEKKVETISKKRVKEIRIPGDLEKWQSYGYYLIPEMKEIEYVDDLLAELEKIKDILIKLTDFSPSDLREGYEKEKDLHLLYEILCLKKT